MLKKDTRRRLKEHGWLEIAKKHKNPTLALKRLKDRAFDAISDLTLLAEKLPTYTLKEIFNNNKNFEKLLDSILKNRHSLAKDSGEDTEDYAVANTLLASTFVSKGINFCMRQYTNKIQRNSVLNEPTVERLIKAIETCNEIAFEMKLSKLRAIEEKEDLIYLFTWNKIKDVHETRVYDVKGEDTNEFLKFIEQERGYAPIEIVHKITSDPFTRSDEVAKDFEITDLGGIRYKGRLDVNLKEKVAHLSLEEGVQEDTLRRDLVIKLENEYVIVYKKKEGVRAYKKKR